MKFLNLFGLNLSKRCYSSIHDMQIEYLRRSFEDYNQTEITNSFSLRKSAVLVPISVRLEKNKKGHFTQQSYFTLTKRTEHLKNYKGQVCFAGGMCEAEDKNELATALREANEEIGINQDHVAYIAQLYPLVTSNRTLVTPVITFFDDTDYEPVINKDEVELVFKIPTNRFILSENHKHKSFKIGNNDEYYVHYFKDMINGVEIQTWGVTALICILVSSILHSRAPNFQVDPHFEFDKDKINEYLKFNINKNMERIENYEKKKK